MKSNNETRISMFPSALPRETLRLSGNKINCFPWEQSLSVYCCVAFSLRTVDFPNLIHSQLALTSAALLVTDSDYLDIAS